MAWGYGEIDNATVRDLVEAATGGRAVRFRISNAFGNAPLQVGAATVGRSLGASAVDPATVRPLTFGGSPSVTIPVGAVAYTDALALPVTAGETLAVSLWVRGPDLVTLHPCCGTAARDWFSPNGGGNVTAAPTLAGESYASPFERFVDAMDVLQTQGRGSVVVIGDSITDGFNASTTWTQALQSRVDRLPSSARPAIVNEGITANALTSYVHTDALTGGGPAAVQRMGRDALSQAGVSEVILLEGTNDLWFGATAAEVIAGYEQAIAEAHAAGVRIIGMTLLPRRSSRTEYWSALDQQEMETVNHWILTSGAFDGVIDSARAVADIFDHQCDPLKIFPPFDSGDHLHPDAAGQVALANAVTPGTIGLTSLPLAAPLVAAIPTPGCSGSPA
ncbi:MAG TPA: GDSL-type esterase/lipase family protein [Acidimicrobiales bacterium]|nr:GDSL-type esterase/lipase family protein [Acidimicrobiales bacterium]